MNNTDTDPAAPAYYDRFVINGSPTVVVSPYADIVFEVYFLESHDQDARHSMSWGHDDLDSQPGEESP